MENTRIQTYPSSFARHCQGLPVQIRFGHEMLSTETEISLGADRGFLQSE